MLLLAGLAWLVLAGTAFAAPRIGVVTMEPGQPYWARFGHNAILVDAGDGREPTLYNYGFFDFDEPGFLLNFLRGRMHYRLVALPMSHDLAYYREEGRGVTLQWLDVEPDAAARLARFLAWNALPENAVYEYDYFIDNCSTRVRDALDTALDGVLSRQLSGRSQGLTYRMESLRLGGGLPWMGLGMHLGLSDYADRPLSRWDEAFVPMRLRDSLREVRTGAGTPLVVAEEALLPHRIKAPPAEPPRWWPRFAFAGIVLAIGVLALAPRRPRTLAGVAFVFWLLCGLAGLGLAALWGLSDHRSAWGNENLLLVSPLCLLLLPGAWARVRGRAPGRAFVPVLRLVAALAGVAVFVSFLPFRLQDNLDWIVLLLPLHLALLKAFGATPRSDHASTPA
jgi:hypothetical protein